MKAQGGGRELGTNRKEGQFVLAPGGLEPRRADKNRSYTARDEDCGNLDIMTEIQACQLVYSPPSREDRETCVVCVCGGAVLDSSLISHCPPTSKIASEPEPSPW